MQLSKIHSAIIGSAFISLFLTGCLNDNKITCSDEEGLSLIKQVITENLEQQLKNKDTGQTLSSIRSTINSLGFDFHGIRTAKQDENNTKVFCEMTAAISIPTPTLNNANAAMKESGMDSNVESVLSDNFRPSKTAANAFEINISYNLQPSDDGKYIYSEIEDGNPSDALAEVLEWALSKDKIIAQAKEQARAEQEAEAARIQQEAADLEKANAAYHAAVARINRTWNALDSYTQDTLRAEQRAINNEREANCRSQSLDIDGDFNEREIFRLNCEVEQLDSRNEQLQYY